MLSRPPLHPALTPFVKVLWASEGGGPLHTGTRERVLPTGTMHLVIRLGDEPLRVFDQTVGVSVVGGARSSFYLRDVSRPVGTVGAQLHPGAALALCGAPADALAERHHSLEDLWGSSAARRARELLSEARTLSSRLALFEQLLVERLNDRFDLSRLITFATERLAGGAEVGAVVEASGYSHRRFLQLFREGVGLTPKVFARLLRFQRAVQRLAHVGNEGLGDLAHELGYADQPHFNREFRAFAGLSPGEYRRISPEFAHHLPLGQFRSRPRGGGWADSSE